MPKIGAWTQLNELGRYGEHYGDLLNSNKISVV